MSTVTNWDDVVAGAELLAVKKRRVLDFNEEKFHINDRAIKLSEGWQVVREVSKGKYIKMRRPKRTGAAFEDAVWMMFARMGFSQLNKDEKFVIYNDKNAKEHQQIDVFAVDDDSVIIVECKAAEEGTQKTFKKEIEALSGQMEWITRSVAIKFPKRKVKFVWATRNIYRSQADEDRLRAAGIIHLDEESVTYYNNLSLHLGSCAKYQFFARIFAREKIGGFENRVYAVKSQLGNVRCYTFAIEPARLLKIGYILHHHAANEDMMPAYQRLIKKSRLKKIREFIEKDNGFFANSLIVSVDTEGKPLKFETLGSDIPESHSSVGVLHLPEVYCSAYVIDGQHRLYAYSDSPLANGHTIPVVAFENLDKHEQLKLFMDINENQKSVPKSLRATLSMDMLWDSDDQEERRQAIASKIAQRLEDDRQSSLKGRIVVGENEKSPNRNVTINAIQESLKKSGFFNRYIKAKGDITLSEVGLLDYDDSDKTFNAVYSLLLLCFGQISEKCSNAWSMTDADSTILVTNRGVQAIVRVVGDVIRYLQESGDVKAPKRMQPEELALKVMKILEPLCTYINELDLKGRKELRVHLGAKADNTFLHEFQKAIRCRYKGFSPDGLDEYMRDESKQYNDETKQSVEKIRDVLLTIFDDKIWSSMSEEAQLMSFPKKEFRRISKDLGDYKFQTHMEDVDFRKFVTIGDLQSLAVDGDNWAIFEPFLSDPNVRKSAAKAKKTAWMSTLDKIVKKLNKGSYSVPASEAKEVARIYEWVVESSTE